jgi:hypothetical protein
VAVLARSALDKFASYPMLFYAGRMFSFCGSPLHIQRLIWSIYQFSYSSKIYTYPDELLRYILQGGGTNPRNMPASLAARRLRRR